MAKPKQGFEADLEQLEKIVSALEEGGLSLDDALKQFETGVGLARRCEKALSEAEKKIEMLVKNADGALEAVPFDEDSPTPDAPAEEAIEVAVSETVKTTTAKAAVRREVPPPPPVNHGGYEEDELPF